MAYQRNRYSPPPHKRSVNIVKRDFRKRLHGKPTYSSSLLSLPRVFSLVLSKAVSLALIIVMAACFLLAGLGSGMLVGYISTASPLDTSLIKSNTKNQTTHIVDDQGADIAILTGSSNINREYISISDVKPTWIDEAVMAIEDERFQEHIGIDPRRIGSAVLSALVNRGSATHGGSTITQQVVKLLTGADEISAQRKVQEWHKAVKLQQEKSKDEIMELYLNLIPMGNSYVGIQSAAKAYFDKDASDLNLVECAFLAGVPNRPSTYNPLTETGRRNALRRMRIVLGKMYDLKMITQKQYEDALDAELVFRKTPMKISSTQINSYFVDYVIDKVIGDLQAKRGFTEKMAHLWVYNYGLTIETTMSQDIQSKVEDTFNTIELFSSDPASLIDLPEKPNGSIVVIENLPPNAGKIRAMVGGYGEKTGNFVFNRAVSAYRQPGSSIKPLVVYGPALDTGKITAASIFSDVQLFLDKDNPKIPYPVNYIKKYLGNMIVREAVYTSTNTIAAYIWKFVLGGETSLHYLKMVGIDRSTENYVAIALGAFNKGMTTLEMTGAYSTFANSGLYTEPYAYTRVLDADGNVLLENMPDSDQVYKPETAFIMTSMLQDVLKVGTAAGYGIEGMHCAGKTGTTDEMRDKWFCGYTPYYTAAVWYGYDNRLSQTLIPKSDRSNATKIWNDAMTKIHEGLEDIDFKMPPTVQRIKVCKLSGMLPSENCKDENIITEYFVPGAMMNPKETCTYCAPEPTPTPVPAETEPTGPVETVP